MIYYNIYYRYDILNEQLQSIINLNLYIYISIILYYIILYYIYIIFIFLFMESIINSNLLRLAISFPNV